MDKRVSMKGLKTNVKAGGLTLNHNQSRKLKLALSRETLQNLRRKTSVKAGLGRGTGIAVPATNHTDYCALR